MFTRCRKQKASIIFLQEMHSTIDKEKQWTKAEWGAPIEFAHGSSNARGVAVLLRNSFDCKRKRRIVDPMGRYIGIKAESRIKTIFCLMFTHLTMIVNPQSFMNILLMFFKYTKIKLYNRW